jgi:hypothetical protein
VVVDVEMAAACPSVPPAPCSARPSPPTTTAQAQSHGHRLLKKQLLQTGKKIVWLVCLLIACFCATPKPENRTRKGRDGFLTCLIMRWFEILGTSAGGGGARQEVFKLFTGGALR